MNRIRYFWVALAILLIGCAKPQDVTHDPAFGKFGAVTGTWKTKAPMQLLECPAVNVAGGNRFLALAGELKMTPMPGEKVLADLPAGTEIRVERLVFAPSWEASLLGVIGSLIAGPYADREAQLDSGLFTRDLIATIEYTHGDPRAINTTWTVDPNMLEK